MVNNFSSSEQNKAYLSLDLYNSCFPGKFIYINLRQKIPCIYNENGIRFWLVMCKHSFSSVGMVLWEVRQFSYPLLDVQAPAH